MFLKCSNCSSGLNELFGNVFASDIELDTAPNALLVETGDLGGVLAIKSFALGVLEMRSDFLIMRKKPSLGKDCVAMLDSDLKSRNFQEFSVENQIQFVSYWMP
jgi:hypothetical protein